MVEVVYRQISALVCSTDLIHYTRHLVSENEYIVVYSEEFVTGRGVRTNHVECLLSLVNLWREKFRGLSKSGLERSVQTYGFIRTLKLVGAPMYGLLDCFVLAVFH